MTSKYELYIQQLLDKWSLAETGEAPRRLTKEEQELLDRRPVFYGPSYTPPEDDGSGSGSGLPVAQRKS